MTLTITMTLTMATNLIRCTVTRAPDHPHDRGRRDRRPRTAA
ncbi:hypothetical protein [Streptomyces sp. NPDC085540]